MVLYSIEGREDALERTRGDRTKQFESPEETPVVAAVTGCRLVAYVPSSGSRSQRANRFPIHFSDIERVGLDDPSDPSVFSLRSTGGVRWKLPVDDTDTVTMATVSRYVRTGADLYGRAHEATHLVQQRREDMLAAAEDCNDQRLTELYDGLVDQLDHVRERATDTPFTEIETFTETLRRTRRTLDRTHTIALLVHIDQRCHAKRQSVEAGEFEAAAEDLGTLRDWYATVRRRVTEEAIDPLGDGTPTVSPKQGSMDPESEDEARRRPSPLGGADAEGAVAIATERIRSLAASLLDHADTKYETAAVLDEPSDRIEHLDTALTLYSTVLYDCWGSPELVPVEAQQLRHRREETVTELIDIRRSVAERRTWVGYEALEAGDTTEAIREFDAALEHLESAHRLAKEFRAGDLEAITDQWAELEEVRPEGVAGVAINS